MAAPTVDPSCQISPELGAAGLLIFQRGINMLIYHIAHPFGHHRRTNRRLSHACVAGQNIPSETIIPSFSKIPLGAMWSK